MFARATSQAVIGLAFLMGAISTATAGSFAVSPVRATLSSKQPAASLVVRNSGPEPTVVQLEVVGWSQEEGKDIYAPTKEILATPPIFTVPPGGSQVVRVGLRRNPDAQRELTYRLFLQEVPIPKPDQSGLRVVLRVGIPVFVNPAVAVAPVLRWQAAHTPDGALKLSLTNSGNAHIQVAKSSLTLASSAQTLMSHDVAAYVLPGQSRDWILKPASMPARGTALRISAQTDAGEMQTEVVLN